MRKLSLISKFLFVVSLTISLLYTSNVFAENINNLSIETFISNPTSIMHWEKGTNKHTEIGEWELVSTGNEKYVETEQTYSTTTSASRVADVTTSIEASGGFVTGTASAGYSSSGEEQIKITYKIITKQIVIYDLYNKYKYYYTEAILIDEYGVIHATDSCGYLDKKEYYSSKEIKTGSKAP